MSLAVSNFFGDKGGNPINGMATSQRYPAPAYVQDNRPVAGKIRFWRLGPRSTQMLSKILGVTSTSSTYEYH